jgi:transposase-like protein
MKKESTKPGQSDNETLKEIPKACLDETAAVEFLEKQRWGDIPACPHCGSVTVKKVTDGQGNRNRRFLWRCGDCKQQFTVRIGTVFEDSRIPLRIWCYAFWKACSSKKGISALQISRECSISYKSALFLMHRIRCAMTEPKKEGKLKGTVEADECYIGGKPRTRMSDTKRGLGTKKTPVMVMVERNGEARTKVLCRVNAKTLKTALTDNVHKCARLMTDEHRCYKWAGSHFNGGHETTIHSMGEYARGDVHSNTAEFSLPY